MSVSQNGLTLIEGFEGFSPTPYQDIGGTWTIGFGFTYDPNGNRITAATAPLTVQEANTWLSTIVVSFVDGIMSSLTKPINQNQLDALTSFAYNLGVGTFEQSSICAKINAGQPVLETDFTQYSFVNGVQSQGLITRRQKEFALFSS